MPLISSSSLDSLQAAFGDRLRFDVPLAPYTSARVGGPAEALLVVESSSELARASKILWESHTPFFILGGGSNLLVSDAGVRAVVLLNRAKLVRFDQSSALPSVWVESGANTGALARQAANKGFSGLEWAAGLPGTVGGAVFGNAGAHGGDMAANLLMLEVLHRSHGKQTWPVEKLDFQYRSSVLKRNPGQAVILAARLRLSSGSRTAIREKLDRYLRYRRETQPPGASMGSMFKNPPGDYAGRLIDQAGLKGARVGDAEISTLHANFFLNRGQATATEVYQLLQLARETVMEKFLVELEPEIEIVGEW